MSHYHIEAPEGAVAEFVLLPGDPLRAKFIAENFLEDAVQYNTVRGMLGFTGYYKGKKVSVQGTGMGMPSAGIYIHELINVYGCKKLVRIGSCGGIGRKVKLRDVIIGMSACTNSKLVSRRFYGNTYAPTSSFELLYKAYNLAIEKKVPVHVGSLLSSDNFYEDTEEDVMRWAEYGVLGVEMEAAELLTQAAKYEDVQALVICTVSDLIPTGEVTTSQERQETFTQMMEIALEL
ncbi:MAG: purine-nucleoside phosphorylase [Tissierellia bacterium]|nr:purine-nucleoside phosphorylase [Tissierellia bacterium]